MTAEAAAPKRTEAAASSSSQATRTANTVTHTHAPLAPHSPLHPTRGPSRRQASGSSYCAIPASASPIDVSPVHPSLSSCSRRIAPSAADALPDPTPCCTSCPTTASLPAAVAAAPLNNPGAAATAAGVAAVVVAGRSTARAVNNIAAALLESAECCICAMSVRQKNTAAR